MREGGEREGRVSEEWEVCEEFGEKEKRNKRD